MAFKRPLSDTAAETYFIGDKIAPGSSLDERVLGIMLIYTLADKIGVPEEKLADAIWASLMEVLQANEEILRRIADALNDSLIIKNPSLQELLACVKRVSTLPPTGAR